MFVERQIALPDGGVDTVTKLSTAVECKEKCKRLALAPRYLALTPNRLKNIWQRSNMDSIKKPVGKMFPPVLHTVVIAPLFTGTR